jgi:hypothetical protein
MSTQAAMAQAVMGASQEVLQNSFLSKFLAQRKASMPQVHVSGALEGWKYNLLLPKDLKLPVKVLMQFSIGEFFSAPGGAQCSRYFDPGSDRYNVFYGTNAVLSCRPEGGPWGFKSKTEPTFDEFVDIPRIDYTYLTAGMFGCPTEMMKFEAKAKRITTVPQSRGTPPVADGWYKVELEATIPSGLHKVPKPVDYPLAYLMYGVPDPTFITQGHGEYHQVKMRGELYMKLMDSADGPMTFVWGALCPTANGGPKLLDTIIKTMRPEYLSL